MQYFDDSKKSPEDMTSEEIIEIIANSKKKDIVRAYVSGELEKINVKGMNGYGSEFEFVGNGSFGVLFGSYDFILPVVEERIRFFLKGRMDCKKFRYSAFGSFKVQCKD